MKMEKLFGDFGGQYVPESMMYALGELEKAYEAAIIDEEFMAEYRHYLQEYSGRPTPLYFAKNLTEQLGGGKVYLKREDLNHTGAHKINNVIGQVLLAKRMGKKKVICETGAGQHGVATATVCTMFNIACEVYMGAEDVERQAINVSKMRLLGAKVHSITDGTATLADAVTAAIQAWVGMVDDTFYVIGSVVGPHPYPVMVRDFQKVIGEETKVQILEKESRLPDHIIACVGGGSNAIGMFHEFINDKAVKIYGVEAAGHGVDTDMHAATITLGKPGIIHGMKTLTLEDDKGEIYPVHSISAGLDYPGVGPEHAFLNSIGRVKYTSATDKEAIAAFLQLTKVEGIIPALESSHALAFLAKFAPTVPKDEIIVVNLSGRGDKDMYTILDILDI